MFSNLTEISFSVMFKYVPGEFRHSRMAEHHAKQNGLSRPHGCVQEEPETQIDSAKLEE